MEDFDELAKKRYTFSKNSIISQDVFGGNYIYLFAYSLIMVCDDRSKKVL